MRAKSLFGVTVVGGVVVRSLVFSNALVETVEKGTTRTGWRSRSAPSRRR